MRLLILSLLALGGAYGHTLAYKTNLLSYAPARGEFPVEDGRGLGYVRYLDGSGAEHLLPYYYPEPLYGVRRLSYDTIDSVHPLLRTTGGSNIFLKKEASSEQNALFRAWCEERYNALKKELDRLRSEGKTPSSNFMAQFVPLEQIIKAEAYDSSIISSLSPEVQRARDEHLRIWNDTRTKVLKAEEEQMQLAGTSSSGEHKPQEDLQLKQFDVKSRIGIESQGKPFAQQLQAVQDTPEVLRAREEHLKLFQQSSSKLQQQQKSSSNQVHLKEYSAQVSESQTGQVKQPIQDTPEVQRVREEHLKLFNQAQFNQQKQQQSSSQQNEYQGKFAIQSQPQPAIKYSQPQTPQETPEVLRAREEHLKVLNEAKLKQQVTASKEQQQQLSSGQYQQKYETESALKYTPQLNVNTRIDSVENKPIEGQFQPVQYTPEVLRAREEHLRLLEQAKLKAQSESAYNENDDGSYKAEQQQEQQVTLKLVPGIQQPIQQLQQTSAFLYQGSQPNLKSSSYDYQEQQQQQQQWGVQDTAEVLKAREEHLRLVNEAKFRIEDRIADDADRIKLFEREKEDANQLREYEMRREEEKQQELERLREEERQKEEKRLLEEERIALQLQEQRRIEMERAGEAERIKKEEIEQLKYKGYEYQGQPELQPGQIITKFITQPQQQKQLVSQNYQQSLQQAQAQQEQQQLQKNGILKRIQANQPNLYTPVPATSGGAAYIVGSSAGAIGQEIGTTGGQYYIPATKDNPFLIRYTQDVRPLKQDYIAIVAPGNLLTQKLKTDGGYAIQSGSSSASASSLSSLSSGSSSSLYTDSSNISELDIATRNHIRAHEIALEQLRLAKEKNPWLPDCN